MRECKWCLLTFSVLLIHFVQAQQLNNSPYTRYGLGEIVEKNTVASFSMGGLSTPLADYRYVNINNPASYSSLMKNNPIFDVGLAGKFSILATDSSKANYSNFGLRNFVLAIPISKQWGLAFGLMPYSTSGYNITDYSLLNGDTVRNQYEGDGSLNRVFLGNGVNLINKGDTLRFSAGFNGSFIFGTLDRQRSVVFDDKTYYNTKIYNRKVVNGATLDAGIQFYQKVNENVSWQFGATYGFKSTLSAKRDFYAYSYQSGFNQDTPKDTIDFYEDQEGKINLPTSSSIGLAVNIKKWMVGVQYDLENWHQYSETFDSTDVTEFQLLQSSNMILGLEYDPKADLNDKNKNIFSKSIYRFGFKYGKTAIQMDSVQLANYGMSFGISMPLISSRSLSRVNLGVEFGKMGTKQNGLIQDNYLKAFIGFSLGPSVHDRWFRKRKYD